MNSERLIKMGFTIFIFILFFVEISFGVTRQEVAEWCRKEVGICMCDAMTCVVCYEKYSKYHNISLEPDCPPSTVFEEHPETYFKLIVGIILVFFILRSIPVILDYTKKREVKNSGNRKIRRSSRNC